MLFMLNEAEIKIKLSKQHFKMKKLEENYNELEAKETQLKELENKINNAKAKTKRIKSKNIIVEKYLINLFLLTKVCFIYIIIKAMEIF